MRGYGEIVVSVASSVRSRCLLDFFLFVALQIFGFQVDGLGHVALGIGVDPLTAVLVVGVR